MHYLVFVIERKRGWNGLQQNVPELLYIASEWLDALSYLKEKCILALIESIGASSTLQKQLEYYILSTEDGPFDHDDLYNDSNACVKMSTTDYDLTRAEPFAANDFYIQNVGDSLTDARLDDFVNALNQRIQKHKESQAQSPDVDQDSEVYKRYVADKNAYVMMKGDGLNPPNPMLASWTLEQLQQLTFEDYRKSKQQEKQAVSSQYTSMFV